MANNVTPDSTVFEFNAPQYLNFTTPVEDDGADRFFDTVSEIENSRVLDVAGGKEAEDSAVVTSSSSIAESTNEEKSDPSSNHEANANLDSVNPVTPVRNEWEHLSSEINAKIQEAQATASSRYVKRAFAPSIEYSDDEPNNYKIVAVEIFHPGVRLQPHRKCTVVKPFSFEERHKRLQKEKEEKIKKFLEEERKMREFHANPAPTFNEPSIRYPTIVCTDSKEPKLRAEERVQERKKNKTEEEKKPLFKAKPAIVLQKPPFEPKKAECPLTDVTGFHLNTEERAKKREEFNMLIKRKEAELELLRLQRKKEEEKALAEEIRLLRKQAVHKANPVPTFKPVPPIFSNIPLTEPKSPCFASRKLTKTLKH